jgi:hypothetical protein
MNMNMNRLLIKKGPELTNQEIVEINQAKAREFHIPKMSKHQIEGSLFFLLKDRDNNILAMGQLISVEPVQFRGETFSILGIVGNLDIKPKPDRKTWVGFLDFFERSLKEIRQLADYPPILYIPVPQVGHLPFKAGFPFFIVTL